jgi:hypothetical protein
MGAGASGGRGPAPMAVFWLHFFRAFWCIFSPLGGSPQHRVAAASSRADYPGQGCGTGHPARINDAIMGGRDRVGGALDGA